MRSIETTFGKHSNSPCQECIIKMLCEEENKCKLQMDYRTTFMKENKFIWDIGDRIWEINKLCESLKKFEKG